MKNPPNPLEKSILATIIYYDCLNCPLSAFELWGKLIRPIPDRISQGKNSSFSLREVVFTLEESVFLSEYVGQKDGFYFLKGREGLVPFRIKAIKISEDKFKRLCRYRFVFLATVFIQGVFVSGSVAQGLAKDESDIDVLIITTRGRLWTARLFLTIWTSLLGIRRKGNKIKDRICLNHYISSDALVIPFESLYNAQSYRELFPALSKNAVFERFFERNEWMGNYFINPFAMGKSKNYAIGQGSILLESLVRLDRRVDEFFLRGGIGNSVEALAKKIQLFFIKKNPLTTLPGGRIAANDWQLEFHPQSKEKQIIEEYNRKLRAFGLAEFYPEKDSGLLTKE